jgi:hypothetical protein
VKFTVILRAIVLRRDCAAGRSVSFAGNFFSSSSSSSSSVLQRDFEDEDESESEDEFAERILLN